MEEEKLSIKSVLYGIPLAQPLARSRRVRDSTQNKVKPRQPDSKYTYRARKYILKKEQKVNFQIPNPCIYHSYIRWGGG